MPTAEIITIGTEILLGEIIDTNAPYIARQLRDAGIDLFRKTSIGDNANRIAQAIRQAMGRCDIVITTGGLGPTVDDPSREAVALAFNVPTEYRDNLWEQIKDRFQRYGRLPTENNRRQAYVPRGAVAIENPVGTAPAFMMETERGAVISLPGVPREMEYLMDHVVIPYLRKRYQLTGIIKARLIHTAGVGESQIDDLIGDLEHLNNPTVGLAAHSGQVDVRITAKAEKESVADQMIQLVEQELRQRLGDWIYGVDQVTLEQVALQRLQEKAWKLVIVEAGLQGELIRRLCGTVGVYKAGESLPNQPSPQEVTDYTRAYRQSHSVEVGLGVAIYPGREKQEITIIVITPDGEQQFNQSYGGPPEYAPHWAANHSLNILRRL